MILYRNTTSPSVTFVKEIRTWRDHNSSRLNELKSMVVPMKRFLWVCPSTQGSVFVNSNEFPYSSVSVDLPSFWALMVKKEQWETIFQVMLFPSVCEKVSRSFKVGPLMACPSMVRHLYLCFSWCLLSGLTWIVLFSYSVTFLSSKSKIQNG